MKFREDEGYNPTTGSTIPTELFFDRSDWISIPSDWSKNIVKGKSYSTNEQIGSNVWRQVQERLQDRNYKEGELVMNEPGVEWLFRSYSATCFGPYSATFHKRC